MEALYKLLVGPINVKDPSESLFLQLWLLKRLGLWAPDTENQLTRVLYSIWSYFYRWFFLYIYTTTQILFLLKAENLADVAEGFFLLLTQIALIYKVETFRANRHRIRACYLILQSSLFQPQNENEDKVIKESMKRSLGFCLCFLILAHFTIASWAVMPFTEKEMRLPILGAWYPFSLDNPWIFSLTYFYQIFGISMSACFNVATDTFASAMISHVNGQVERLGIQLSKIGHAKNNHQKRTENANENVDQDVDAQMVEINNHVNNLMEKHSENYGEIISCTIYHEHVLHFASEIQDLFKGPIFAQIFFSCIIICMTCFLLVSKIDDVATIISMGTYLATMVTQILLFCWIGNELNYSSHQLTMQAYFSNFQSFNQPSAKAMLIFMQRSIKDITMKAGGLFEVTLSLPTFMGIIKSSYSYFALLQSMQNK